MRPPPRVSSVAARRPNTDRERTVIPMTTPSVSAIRYPSRANDVVVKWWGILLGLLIALVTTRTRGDRGTGRSFRNRIAATLEVRLDWLMRRLAHYIGAASTAWPRSTTPSS